MAEGRIAAGGAEGGPPVDIEMIYTIVDVLHEIAEERGKTIAQVALNWVLSRPSVCNVIIGARNEEQLVQNLGAVGWQLSEEEIARLDRVSQDIPIYPYWHQKGFDARNPKPTTW